MNDPNQSLVSRKEELDVSRIFLAYLSTGGDTVAAAQVAGCSLDDVLYLAKSECWDAKLADAGVVRGRNKDDAQQKMREVNRMTAYIQGIRLRGLIDLTLKWIYEDSGNISKFAEETNKRGESFFSTKPVLDLVKAAEGVHLMIYRALGDVVKEEEGGVNMSNIKNLHLTVVQAMAEGTAPEAVMKNITPPEGAAPAKQAGYLDLPVNKLLD